MVAERDDIQQELTQKKHEIKDLAEKIKELENLDEKSKKLRDQELAELKERYGDKLNCLDLCQDPEKHNRYIKLLGLDNGVYNNSKKINQFHKNR